MQWEKECAYVSILILLSIGSSDKPLIGSTFNNFTTVSTPPNSLMNCALAPPFGSFSMVLFIHSFKFLGKSAYYSKKKGVRWYDQKKLNDKKNVVFYSIFE